MPLLLPYPKLVSRALQEPVWSVPTGLRSIGSSSVWCLVGGAGGSHDRELPGACVATRFVPPASRPNARTVITVSPAQKMWGMDASDSWKPRCTGGRGAAFHPAPRNWRVTSAMTVSAAALVAKITVVVPDVVMLPTVRPSGRTANRCGNPSGTLPTRSWEPVPQGPPLYRSIASTSSRGTVSDTADCASTWRAGTTAARSIVRYSRCRTLPPPPIVGSVDVGEHILRINLHTRDARG